MQSPGQILTMRRRITGFGSGNGSSKYAYNATGKLERETIFQEINIFRLTTKTEVVWDGNNIERGFITLTSRFGEFLSQLSYDTVLFEHGDQVNVFADTTYLGYNLTHIGNCFPFLKTIY